MPIRVSESAAIALESSEASQDGRQPSGGKRETLQLASDILVDAARGSPLCTSTSGGEIVSTTCLPTSLSTHMRAHVYCMHLSRHVRTHVYTHVYTYVYAEVCIHDYTDVQPQTRSQQTLAAT